MHSVNEDDEDLEKVALEFKTRKGRNRGGGRVVNESQVIKIVDLEGGDGASFLSST